MYGNNYAMQPPPFMPWFPPQTDPAQQITGWITSLEALKKHFKEEKKEEKKKEPPVPSVFGMMLLMLLVSPITGPFMYHFFQASLALLPKAN